MTEVNSTRKRIVPLHDTAPAEASANDKRGPYHCCTARGTSSGTPSLTISHCA